MPNWFCNELLVIGDAGEAASLRRLMTTKRSVFDFEAIVPMPEEVRGSESSSNVDLAWGLKYGDWIECSEQFGGRYGPSEYASRQEAMQAAEQKHASRPSFSKERAARSLDELADIAQGLLERHGHRDWYSWACGNWGTKWLADDCVWMGPPRAAKRDAAQVATFRTANSPAVALIKSLSQRFPTLTLRLSYAEELNDWSGFVTLEAGEIVAEKHTEGEKRFGWLCHDLRDHDGSRVYVGDARDAEGKDPAFAKSKWANPFRYAADPLSSRQANLYRLWVLGDAEAAKAVPAGDWHRPTVDEIRDELRNADLLCDCGGKDDTGRCHGWILLRLADGWDGEEEDYSQDEHDPPRAQGNVVDAAGGKEGGR